MINTLRPLLRWVVEGKPTALQHWPFVVGHEKAATTVRYAQPCSIQQSHPTVPSLPIRSQLLNFEA